MLEYTIMHIFDKFRLNFSNSKGQKKGKTFFFHQFFKICKNGIFFTCNMSMEMSWNVENLIFVHFQK